MRQLVYSLLFIAILLFGVQPASGVFILGNLDANEANNIAGAVTVFDSSGAISIGFTVGATPITITSVDFRLRANTGTSNTGSVATLGLRDNDGSGNPGASVAKFSPFVVAGTAFQSASFNAIDLVELTPNTTYWLTLGTTISGNGDGLIAGSRNPAVNPTGPLALFAGLRTGTPNNQTIPFTGAPSVQLNGTVAIPEPASIGLVALTTAVVGACARRRKLGVDS